MKQDKSNRLSTLKTAATGIEGLDKITGGGLLSGPAGSDKTSLAAHFAHAAAARRERCLWSAFEESPSQITRNMRSIGLDLEPALTRGGRAAGPLFGALEEIRK